MRTLGTDDRRSVNTGSTKRTPTMIPSFAVSPPDAAQLRRIARMGQLRLRLNGQSRVPENGQSQNVVAEIRGRERPDEIIAVGGHLDSWDRGTGAIDDAAGIAITTAAVKLIAELPIRPKRTIRVVWFGSEELSQPDPTPGLQGGRRYALDHTAEAPLHIAVSESDFGAGHIWALGLPQGWQNGAFQREVMRVLAPIGVTFRGEPATAGGDFSPMGRLGVPGWDFSQDGSKYFDVHHTPDDTLERIDPRELNQNVAAWAAILWMIADSDVDFRKPAPDYVAPAS
jgi:Zn-dependent M28 family amino/carboxypeptidase